MKGKDQLQLNIGFSHDVVHQIPTGVEVKVSGAKQEIITVTGIDPQLVGQVAANIRASRPPEPYQGKGIRYLGERCPVPVHCIPTAGLPIQGPNGETIFPEQPDELAGVLQEFSLARSASHAKVLKRAGKT